MKKFLILLLLAAAGVLVWRKVSAGAGERDLWAEVTDSLE